MIASSCSPVSRAASTASSSDTVSPTLPVITEPSARIGPLPDRYSSDPERTAAT